MRVSKKGWVVVAAILMVTALVWVVCSWPPTRSHKLPDGSVLRVERVSYGKRDQNFVPRINVFEDIKAKLASFLPKKWAAKIPLKGFAGNGNWWRWAYVHTNEDALHIWITQRDLTNGFEDVQAGAAVIVDEHGCVYPSSQEGGIQLLRGTFRSGGGPEQSAVSWFTFEAFPRRESKMLLRLYKSPWGGTAPPSELMAEFLILNPAPKPVNSIAWAIEPLPIEKNYGGVTFRLKGVGFKTNWIDGQTNFSRRSNSWSYSRYPVEMVPEFEVFEGGKPTLEWEALDIELRDSSGNIAPQQWGDHLSVFLSPREPAWKLTANFFGSERESGASNTVWVMRDVKVPGPAAYTAFTNEQDLDGVQVKPVALTGPGEAVYRGDALSKISEHGSNTANFVSFGAGFGTSVKNSGTEEIVDTVMPYIALRLGDMADDQRLTIRAVAPGGAEYYAEPWRYGTNRAYADRISYLDKGPIAYHLNYFPIDLPSDVQTVDLYFCMHRATTVEFVFKPPPQ
jgi:hypothetical protein